MNGPYAPHLDLTGAEIDTLYRLAQEFPNIVEPGDLPSKSGCSGLFRRGLVSYMYGGSAVCLEAGMREYIRRASLRTVDDRIER